MHVRKVMREIGPHPPRYHNNILQHGGVCCDRVWLELMHPIAQVAVCSGMRLVYPRWPRSPKLPVGVPIVLNRHGLDLLQTHTL